MKLNWETHYTEISIAKLGWLYLQRNTKTGALQFARIAPEGRWAKWLRYTMLGIFLGRTNHLNEKGVEIFTSDLHCGFTRRNVRFGISWSGSMVDSHNTYSIRLWHFFIGSTTDKWLKKIIDDRISCEMAYWELAEPPEQQWEREEQ